MSVALTCKLIFCLAFYRFSYPPPFLINNNVSRLLSRVHLCRLGLWECFFSLLASPKELNGGFNSFPHRQGTKRVRPPFPGEEEDEEELQICIWNSTILSRVSHSHCLPYCSLCFLVVAIVTGGIIKGAIRICMR